MGTVLFVFAQHSSRSEQLLIGSSGTEWLDDVVPGNRDAKIRFVLVSAKSRC